MTPLTKHYHLFQKIQVYSPFYKCGVFVASVKSTKAKTKPYTIKTHFTSITR